MLCPGGVYDRSPCGTGTSAKLACLAADGKLEPGATFVQQSITGGKFSATYSHCEQGSQCEQNSDGENVSVVARITGGAFICGETNLIGQQNDPFGCGVITGENS